MPPAPRQTRARRGRGRPGPPPAPPPQNREGVRAAGRAARHAGEAVVRTLDLRRFFPSVPAPRVHGISRAFGDAHAMARSSRVPSPQRARRRTRPARSARGSACRISSRARSPRPRASLAACRRDLRLAGLARRQGVSGKAVPAIPPPAGISTGGSAGSGASSPRAPGADRAGAQADRSQRSALARIAAARSFTGGWLASQLAGASPMRTPGTSVCSFSSIRACGSAPRPDLIMSAVA